MTSEFQVHHRFSASSVSVTLCVRTIVFLSVQALGVPFRDESDVATPIGCWRPACTAGLHVHRWARVVPADHFGNLNLIWAGFRLFESRYALDMPRRQVVAA